MQRPTSGVISRSSVRTFESGVYLITDRSQTRGRPLVETVESALRGGVRAVQLRERDLATRDLLALALALRAVTARHGAALLISDRIDIVLPSGADGVHLPASSFAIRDARMLLGPGRLIAVSTHHPDEVAAARAAGADLAVFGPVFATPSKQAYGPPPGLTSLAEAVAVAQIPLFAIGGVTAERLSTAESGVRIADLMRQPGNLAGVAVIRAILAADDPEQAARDLINAIGPIRASA